MVKLENDHEKDFRKIKTLLKKKKESIGKLEKKLKNGKQEPELCKLRDNMLKDMRSRCEIFVDQEKMAVREISCQERTQYTTFSACLKSVLSEEFEMLSKAALLNEVMERLNEIIADPFKNLQYLESIITPPLNSSQRDLNLNNTSKRCYKEKETPQKVASTRVGREKKQQGSKQPTVRSLSPYSVPLNTQDDDNKVTTRPPIPQKMTTLAKSVKVQMSEDSTEIIDESGQQTVLKKKTPKSGIKDK